VLLSESEIWLSNSSPQVLTIFEFIARPIENCRMILNALTSLIFVFISSTAFFLFFGLCWLCTVAASGLCFKVFGIAHIGPTNFCMESVDQKFLLGACVVLLIYDTFIYLTMTYRIYQMFREGDASLKEKLNMMILGKPLPLISRVLLLDSQVYFFVIVFTKAFLVFAIKYWGAPLNTMFIICHFVVVNILTSRVYRNIRMRSEAMVDSGMSKDVLTLEFKERTSLESRSTFTPNSSST